MHQLRYLVALADELNFTRAAARCWVSQQAFSKAIAQLERRLGVALAVRRPRGCSLTSAGERLAASARRILAQADQMVSLADWGASCEDVLRVGLLLDGLGPVTTPVLTAFRAAAPSVSLSLSRIQPSDLTTALAGGLVDVALLHGPVADERIETVPLFTEPRAVVLSQADARADAAQLAAADLLTLPARRRHEDIDPGWEGFFTLRAERNGDEPRRHGAPAGSLEEPLWSISLDKLFLTMPRHHAVTYPGPVYGVAYVPVPDLPPVTFAACYRRGDTAPRCTGSPRWPRQRPGERDLPRVAVESAGHWESWLRQHHAACPGIWLVTAKKGRPGYLSYDDIVDIAISYGWVDSLPRTADPGHSERLLTPRRPGSNWSRVNKQRVERLTAAGRMTPAGLAVVEAARRDGTWTALDTVEDLTEPAALDAAPAARANWDSFPRSAKRAILEWIGTAKTGTTRDRRIQQTVDEAAAGRRANQWRQPKA